VGNYLEHARIIYFHNQGQPRLYGGSADMMVRSFDKRIESLFEFINQDIKQQLINILKINLLDNCNTYILKENGEYQTIRASENQINIHKYFFDKEKQNLKVGELF
jgi:polyphosphate kinase